ncbi:hypothetical protein EYZ11_001341 [Aspergillus tanneri]|uniref:Endoplasmic reticulum junction formation protein lunapark n=1 Tax=Aspergillus tanneri TaxID=1220188 RepID=A0A4S3JUU7_9EURO|nr:uncharacterized protein ATNIH1004_002966 [Aspergillus tanneri]KAA8650284.1 hypothetical protein ATNIH1004_002966 [Aspergillus tanneri]THC99166.1 hypothetical protein EYZ11_001341 [Aspergillus tanneri]
MVSLWPFKGEDNSPASFEKALSTLSTKIVQTTSRLEAHRQHARRFKALWTLYTTFAYLLYSIILALVLGWENWGAKEYFAVVGGPILIYVVRAAAGKYFDYRIGKSQRYLDDLHRQRDETIEKLKVATKYNSTQQLLEKYAGESPKQQPRTRSGDEKRKSESKRKPSNPQPPIQRTGLAPPPTANIQTPCPVQPPPTAPLPDLYPPSSPYASPQRASDTLSPPPAVDEPGFAPNAFPSAPQYVEHSHWYDRLLDVLLGEDETQPKNRMALICTSCRLVNGQAPPGIKTLEELGRWRCGSCGAWNGEESETKKVLAGIRSTPRQSAEGWEPVSGTDSENHSSADDVTDDGVMVAASEYAQKEPRSSDADSRDEEEPQTKEVEEPQPEAERKGKATRGRPKGGRKKK